MLASYECLVMSVRRGSDSLHSTFDGVSVPLAVPYIAWRMPEDLQKKRERDRRYRERQKKTNPQYLEKRRAICKKSHCKKVSNMSNREARMYRRNGPTGQMALLQRALRRTRRGHTLLLTLLRRSPEQAPSTWCPPHAPRRWAYSYNETFHKMTLIIWQLWKTTLSCPWSLNLFIFHVPYFKCTCTLQWRFSFYFPFAFHDPFGLDYVMNFRHFR